jgi:type II secretion system protein G
VKKLTKNNKGFTLIELLVVVAIIGLLSSVVLISLNTARSKARDAKRLADVRQVATALETYYNDNGKYPEAAANPTTAAAAHTYLGGTLTPATPAFSTYMTVVPQAPTPADGACTSTNNPTSSPTTNNITNTHSA